MKKGLLVLLVGFLFLENLFSQSVDRSKYTAIDPFDYELQSKQVANGNVRKYKSIVTFVTQSGTTFMFNSLDDGTSLWLEATRRYNQMSYGQKVTIYYTATKNYSDKLVLDDIDYTNASAETDATQNNNQSGSITIDKTKYTAIDPFDYELQSKQVANGNVRKYKSTVTFITQSGTTFMFNSLDGGTSLWLEATRRYNQMSYGQKVTIYYTATRNYSDKLVLDDIDY